MRDLALSPDGSELIAITDSSIKHLDPVSLAESASTLVIPGTDFFLKNMAVSNDGNVFVVSEEIDVLQTAANYVYIPSTRTFFSATLSCDVDLRSTGSADGSSIIVINDGLRGARQFCEYDASAGSFLDQNAFDTRVCRDCPSALSSRGIRYAYGYDVSSSGIIVYDNDDSTLLKELGRIAGTFSSIAFDQEGNTLYAYDRVNGLLRTYDLTTPLPGNTFQEVGSGTSLAGSTGEKVKMQVSQDDGTIFVAGETAIAVQPLP